MSASPPPPVPVRRKSCLLTAAVCALVFLLILVGLWWWFNRPIQPVVLTPPERAVVEKKMEVIQAPAEPTYEKGVREIVLTERELNGLLNENGLGETLKLELVTNAIHARYEMDLDKDLPVVGGRRFKARARFLVGGTHRGTRHRARQREQRERPHDAPAAVPAPAVVAGRAGFHPPRTLSTVYCFASSSVSCFDHGTRLLVSAPGPLLPNST